MKRKRAVHLRIAPATPKCGQRARVLVLTTKPAKVTCRRCRPR